MAVTPPILSTALIPTQAFRGSRHQFLILRDHKTSQQLKRKKNPTTPSFIIQAAAAKHPPGVELPKVEPKCKAPFLGFTTTTEDWNSRVCMIGLIGIFIIELIVGGTGIGVHLLIINKGILQLIGVEVGKGLNLPL